MKTTNKIKPLKKKTLKDRIYQEIKELLRSSQIGSNSLITASNISKVLGVSRTPAREALLQLASEGFVEAIGGRGFVVREYSEEEIHDYFEARRIIEVYLVGQLLDTITSDDLVDLDKILEDMASWIDKGDLSEFLNVDRKFHLHLIQLHGNKFLESITEKIRILISILGRETLANPGRMKEVVHEHSLILEGIKAGDRHRVEDAVAHHLKTTEDRLIERLQLKNEQALTTRSLWRAS
jgi:DNA-binding GntR family transcriptional regulator